MLEAVYAAVLVAVFLLVSAVGARTVYRLYKGQDQP
jgi:hypothetical protein